MTDRAGCVSGSRGFGARIINGVRYDVYKIYVAKQISSFDQDEQDKLTKENTEMMESDRRLLKREGYKTRVFHKDCNTIHVLYYGDDGKS